MSNALEQYQKVTDPDFVWPDFLDEDPREPTRPVSPAPEAEQQGPPRSLEHMQKVTDPGFEMPPAADFSPKITQTNLDPFKQALLESENPTETAAKIRATLHMADRLNMNPYSVWRNFDQIAEKYIGTKRTPLSVLETLENSRELGKWTWRSGIYGEELWKAVRAGKHDTALLEKIDQHKAVQPAEDPTGRKLPLQAVK